MPETRLAPVTTWNRVSLLSRLRGRSHLLSLPGSFRRANSRSRCPRTCLTVTIAADAKQRERRQCPDPGRPARLGKTTIAGLLAGARERAVHLESDTFFHFITSGYIEPWKPESHDQNTVAMAAAGDAAARYAHAGYFTIIEGIISPRWFFPPLRQTLTEQRLEVAYATLRPTLATAIERARTRSKTRLAAPV